MYVRKGGKNRGISGRFPPVKRETTSSPGRVLAGPSRVCVEENISAERTIVRKNNNMNHNKKTNITVINNNSNISNSNDHNGNDKPRTFRQIV